MFQSLLLLTALWSGVTTPSLHTAEAKPALASSDSPKHTLPSLHPADADLYLELPAPARMWEACPKLPWNQMLADAEMKKLFALVSSFGLDLSAVAEQAFPAKLTAPESPLRQVQHLSLSLAKLDTPDAQVEGWIRVRCSNAEQASALVAMLETENWISAQPQTETPATLKLSEQASTLRTYTLGAALAPLGMIAGRMESVPLTMWMAQDNATLWMGFAHAKPEQLEARAKREQPSLPASDLLFADDSTWGPSSGLPVYRLWVDLDPTAWMSNPAIAQAQASLGTAAAWILPTLFPYLGAKGVWRVDWREPRLVTDTKHTRYPSMSTTAMGAGPLDSKVARFVPAEAVGAWLTSIEPQRFEAELRSMVALAMAGEGADAATLTPEQLSSLPSLHAGLGKQAAFFLLPINNIQAIEPRLFIALELVDRAAFESALDQWATKFAELAPQAKISNKPYRKHKLVSFAGEQEEEAAAAEAGPFGSLMSGPSFSPTIGVLPDRVLITLKKGFAQTEMRRVLDGKDTAAHSIASGVQAPAGVYEIATMDWAAYTGKLLDIAKGLLPMAAGMMGSDAAAIDVNGLPGMATMQRYFQPTKSWSKRLEDGRILSHSESSFGPETPLTLAAVALWFVPTAAGASPFGAAPISLAADEAPSTPTAPPEQQPEVSAPDLETQSALIAVRAGIAVYRSDAGSIPAKLEFLSMPTANFPDAFLNGKPLPKDGWNRALVYKPEADGKKYALYSMGPNGVDDNGTGDDIKLK